MIVNFSADLPSICAKSPGKTSARSSPACVFLLLAIWIGAWLPSPSVEGTVAQPIATPADRANHGKRVPSISATPERVAINIERGSTEIRWDTGDQSVGFVFVSVNGGKPGLFATASKGSRVLSWIGVGSYVFELCGDAERQTLLAGVTVSGISAPQVSPLDALWQRRAVRWVLGVVVVAVLYVAIYLSAPGAIPKGFRAEPSTSPRQLHVARNLLIGVAVFTCLDGAIFHTGLYTSILAPASYAGRMATLARAEKQRVSSGLKEVLVVGDSRIAEGFSAAAADKLGSAARFKFLSLAEPGSSIDIWYYALREVDPAARRYSAIVIPYGYGSEQSHIQLFKISMAAPLLHYSDCFDFPSGFQQWSDRFRAFTACIFRGSALQSDVVDLLEHPIVRAKSIQLGQKRLAARAIYKGRDSDITGTSYDPKTGQITFPPRLTEAQREAIRYSLAPPSQSATHHLMELQRVWIQRILDRYSGSPTAIILMPMPRGPFGGGSQFSLAYGTFFGGIAVHKPILLLPEHTFDFLESPQYYFDGYHLNGKGRQKFTEAVVAELVTRLQSADSTHLASDPE